MNEKNKKNQGKDKRPVSAAGETAQTPERIAKRLARAGVASRREAESLIAAGRVKVNGKLLDTPAVNVTASDRIEIDNEPIPTIERTRLFLFHKPAGVVTTNHDPQGRRTVFDVLPEGLPRLITVGRLDINTEGLLLLTNDGGLARVLELPQTGWLRRYRVRVHGEVDEAALAGLKEGIAVDGVFYGAIEATLDRRQGTNAWLAVGLREGKNREVKNVMAALGLEVTRLIRVSYGPFQLGDLEEGQVRELRGRMLRDQLGPRLIEEAGANFDAPIVTPFSSKPEAAREERSEPRGAGKDRPRQPRSEREPLREEAGGLIRNRKRDRGERRDAALSRLSTSAPAGRGPKRDDRRGRDDRPREPEVRRSRTSNVWMAPGARPGGTRKARDEEKETERPRPRRDERPHGERGAPGKPKRDWKAKPPRPGKAERAAAATGEAPQREYRPRPKPRDGEERRRFSPLEGEMSPKAREGGGKGRAGRNKAPRPAAKTPPGRSAATLPSRGRGVPRTHRGPSKGPGKK